MKYRKYNNMKIQIFLITISILTVACSGMRTSDENQFACEDCLIIKEDVESKAGESSRTLASTSNDEAVEREPASMVGGIKWLNEVQDDFDRIAAESSQRSVANSSPSILIARKRWSFQYYPDRNDFGLRLDNEQYSMVQTKFENTGVYAFAAMGQVESPITLSVVKKDGDYAYAGSSQCVFELSFWDDRNRKYGKDTANIRGQRCREVINKLRSFVP